MTGRNKTSAQPPDTRAHAVIQDAIDKGYLDSGRKYLVPPNGTHDDAREVQQWVLRGLHHFNLAPAAWVTDANGQQCWKECADPAAKHGVGFELHSKRRARAKVVTDTGGDPSKLRFNPHAKSTPGRFSDDGTWNPNG